MLDKCPQAGGVGPHDDLCQATAVAGVPAASDSAAASVAAGQADVIG